MKPAATKKLANPAQLTWSHFGVLHRVTAESEVRFEAHRDGKWVPFIPDPASDIYASAAVMLGRNEWSRFLEFLPLVERNFIAQFKWSRLAALTVLSQCPELLSTLETLPALTPFVAAHAALRGTNETHWTEIRAVFERAGVFGLMEWLGLPATRQTLSILGQLPDADIPKRLLEPLRVALWSPQARAVLTFPTKVTEQDLVARCLALAA